MKNRIVLHASHFQRIVQAVVRNRTDELFFYSFYTGTRCTLCSVNSFLEQTDLDQEGLLKCTLLVKDELEYELEGIDAESSFGYAGIRWIIFGNRLGGGFRDVCRRFDVNALHKWPFREISDVLDALLYGGRLVDSSTGAVIPVTEMKLSLPQGLISKSIRKDDRNLPRESEEEIHHRTLLWLGSDNMQLIKQTTLGCVGAGGLMNPFITYAMHHGFEKFVISDDDTLDASNLNRFLGAAKDDIGKHKVDIMKRSIERFNPRSSVAVLRKNIPDTECEQLLRDCDVLIAGVDNDYSRFQAQLFALKYHCALFDMGSGIFLQDPASVQPVVEEIGGQIRVYIPEAACLVCMGLDLSQLKDFQRRELEMQRGYIVGTDITPPSVVTLNTTIASLALSLLVNYISGKGLPAHHLSFDGRNFSMHKIAAERNKHCAACGTPVAEGSGRRK